MEAADGGEEDGTILWELVEAADGGEEDGTILWEIVETTDGGEEDGTILWEIFDIEYGRVMCRAERGRLVDASTGRVLFQVSRDAVYQPRQKTPTYVFRRDQVLDANGRLLIRTSPEQQSASDGRQLIIAALLAGVCRPPAL